MRLRWCFALVAILWSAGGAAAAPPPVPASPSPSTLPSPAPAVTKPSARPAPASLVLQGTVRGPDGAPVVGAAVAARAVDGSYRDVPLFGRTDAAGRFSLPLPRAVPFVVRVEAPGLAAALIERAKPGAPLDVRLSAGLAIEGRVKDGTTGAVLPGARVEARSASSAGFAKDWSAPEPASAVTTADGRFRITGLAPGAYHVTATVPGRAASRPDVRTGQRVDLFAFPAASLRGTVLDAQRKAAAGAVVRLEPYTPGGRSSAGDERTTDGRGGFAFPGLRPGGYRVAATLGEAAPALSPIVLVDETGTRDVTLALGDPHTVTGRLVSGDRGVPGTVVIQETEGRSLPQSLQKLLTTEAATDGRFKISRVPSGAAVLAVRAPGYTPRRVDVLVDAPRVDAGDVSLDEGLAIAGHVRDREGVPLGDVQLRAFIPRGLVAPEEARSDGDGAYRIGGLQPGRHTIFANAPGYASGRQEADAGTESVDLVLDRAGSVSGSVVDEAGAVPAFTVSLMDASDPGGNGPMQEQSFEAGDGRFTVPDVAAGRYVLEVRAPDHAPQAVSQAVVAVGADTNVGIVRLTGGALLRGHVSDGTGAAVAGATVTVFVASEAGYFSGDDPQAVTDGDGRFELRGLRSGVVTVIARHPAYAPAAKPRVTLDVAKAAEVALSLSAGGRIQGVARGRDGSPFAGSRVEAMAAVGAPTWDPLQGQGGTVSDDGTYAIEHVMPGITRVVLLARAGNRYSSTQSRSVDVAEGAVATVDFLSRDVRLSGRVSGADGPRARVRLTFSGDQGGAMMSYGGPTEVAADAPHHLWAVTRDDGSYEMIVDLPGSYRVSLRSEDGRASFPARTVDVPDVEAATMDFDLPGVTISGIVVDRDTQQGIADATVSAMTATGTRAFAGRAPAGADGVFRLELEPGEYRLFAGAKDYAAGEARVAVTTAGAPDTRIPLSRGSAIVGTVVDAAGRPVGGAGLTATAPEGDPDTGVENEAYTLPDGSFRLEQLREGTYNLLAFQGDNGFAVQPAVATGGEPIALRLRPSGRVSVRVTGPGAAKAWMQLVSVDGVRVIGAGGASTNAAGVMEASVPVGRVEIRVAQTGRDQRLTLEVKPGLVAHGEVAFPPQ